MRITAIVAACLALTGISVASDVEAAAIRRSTSIGAQGLGPALETLAKERNFQILYVTSVVSGLRTDGAVGEFTDVEAIEKLLNGTGLTYRQLDDKTVMVVSAKEPAKPTAAATDVGAALRLAQGEIQQSTESMQKVESSESEKPSSSSSSSETSESEGQNTEGMPEIVVTGSRLRYQHEPAIPVQVYDREDIDRTGQTTISDFLRTVPQASANVDSTQFAGSSVRLHGLPLGTTMILLNGRRIAPPGGLTAGSNIFDLGVIPLEVVERIDVVPVGTSAVYGSDGIAGVINGLLKDELKGIEASVKYGAASDTDESTFSLALGVTP